MKSLNNKNKLTPVNIFYLLLLVLSTNACGVDADQRNFEQEALRPPKGITKMTIHGSPVENSDPDPDDWRISPEYYGAIEVQTPAYPNPVSFNQMINIELYIPPGTEAISGLFVRVYQPQTSNLLPPIFIEPQPTVGLSIIRFKLDFFAQTGITNLYRIVIYDGSNNIITYGDVKVK